ncbi:SusC/RagA family TonB-linked outer membrane protein [Danxiaibacter flavus]|uniref:SusC/RagA family TonB-linked outer membrane protein n=1 Tax=Danxiaibacter flavus TaxID=3049108 RepID=A0ABV3ZI04_9BACT|nr:SusC/RagA family TonB-linked outer membrane protein [Chitinophagaceae bacterium DXS]
MKLACYCCFLKDNKHLFTPASVVKLALSFVLFSFFTVSAYSQTGSQKNDVVSQSAGKFRGVVMDEAGKPLAGASVQIRGTQTGTQTNENGEFTLNPNDKATSIIVSFVNYESAEINIKGKTSVTVSLKLAMGQSQEVVVVGYTTQKKELLTGSVATVKFGNAETEVPTTMVANVLAGKAAGVSVGNMNGIPGQSSPSVAIHTATSWNSQPVLYVIDGKISGAGDFNNLSPNEIDNVSILKDAATSAVYGSRAAGGVIVVTTKRGKAGKASVNYSFNTGVDTRTKGVQLTSAVQEGKLFNTLAGPFSWSGFWTWSQGDFDYFNSHDLGNGKGWGYDMLKDVWRNPFTQTHQLNVSGGSDKIRYYVGGSYVSQDGFLKNLTFNKYNVRANVTADVSKNFQLFAGVALNNNITHSTTNTGIGDPSGIYRKLLVWQPDQPVWTTGATPGQPVSYGWIGNMGAEVNGQGGNINYNYLKPVITLSGTYKVPFVKGLSAGASFIKSYTENRQHNFMTQYQMANVKTASAQGNQHIWYTDSIVGYQTSSSTNPPYIEQVVTWSEDKQLNFQLNYDRTFADVHHLKAWLIYENYTTSGSGVDAYINGFPVYVTDQWWAAAPQSGQNVNRSTKYSTYTDGRKSWAGQLFYDYAGKYLATFAYRYDGSAKFAPDQRWGVFPSASLGWIISKEKFFRGVRGIELLKLRGSAGLTGNDGVGGWQWQQSYQQGSSAYFGSTPATSTGITYGGIINPALTWEKSLNKNVAVDVNFLKHYSASLEYWNTYTYDILGQRIQTTPPTFSRALPSVNYGKVKGQGLDLTLGYNNMFGKVRFNTSVTASYGYAWNVLKDQNVTYDYQDAIKDGRHTNYIAGYKTEGMLKTQDDLTKLLASKANYTFNGIAPALGQLVYKDINGANNVLGKPDGVVDGNDMVVLKKDNNPIVLGWHFDVGYKGFNLSGTFNGYVKQWKNVSSLAGGVEWNRMWNKWATDMWSPTNTNGSLPYKYSANDGTNGVTSSFSDFWLKNSSFLRLRDLTLSYTIPQAWYQKYGFDNVHIFATGTNLFIISKFNKQYFDPEGGGGDGTAFPIMRSFNAGISVTF